MISVFIKNLKAEDVQTDIQPRSLSLTIKLPTGSEAVFDLDPLFADVNPAASSSRVLSTKIEVKLAKVAAGTHWRKLEADPADARVVEPVRHPQYVTSSRKKTDWDALAREAQKEEDAPADSKDPNGGGDKALNKLFQQLYAGATDDQRRAMMKSCVRDLWRRLIAAAIRRATAPRCPPTGATCPRARSRRTRPRVYVAASSLSLIV